MWNDLSSVLETRKSNLFRKNLTLHVNRLYIRVLYKRGVLYRVDGVDVAQEMESNYATSLAQVCLAAA